MINKMETAKVESFYDCQPPNLVVNPDKNADTLPIYKFNECKPVISQVTAQCSGH